ncbi:helix-turn-helix domain-containing protein [Cellulosimicrobium arenosum]|uniref:Helix-turn-helix transcriptional regulator n=1 Tax=Cellulosimicrobium arenosum TaxID=2708133 RepID=A0A927G7N8_9MICO|nr:helix-turn-helix transcriptional regulator [Cellulosimicrobium arenosum]MBD8078403.1 helix-turn-helix transcriptional regulator [Cellulosimicrobium arenosum]
MALRFRNIDVSPDDPVETWGVDGLATAIERGYLVHWRRIARAVETAPDGPVSRDLEEALAIVEPDSAAASLLRDVLHDAGSGERLRVARLVRRAVRRSGVTAAQFADEAGTSASRLSTYASGKVVPSATTLLRIEDTGERLAARTPLAAGAWAVGET